MAIIANTKDDGYSLDTIEYEVQDGDTYESIARKFNITISELIFLNNMTAYDLDVIYIGSVLKVGRRRTSTGEVIDTGITTDDSIEQAYRDASLQSISVDTVTQEKLRVIKEVYRQTGTVDSIIYDLKYISDRGYTRDDIKVLLNEYDINISGIDTILEDNNVGNTTTDSTLKKMVDSSLYTGSSGTGGSYDDSDFSKDTILGLPFRYNTYSDPRRRVYNSTFMTDAPIVSIIPGKPLFRSAEEDEDGLFSRVINELFGTDNDSANIFEKTASTLGLRDTDDETVLSWLKASQKSNLQNGDLRYYRFMEDYDTFERYLDINLSTLSVKMGVGELGNARYKHFMSRNNSKDSFLGIGRSFKFYCTKSGTSSSESISNEFGDSQIAGVANNVSEALQEFHYLTGRSVEGFTKSAGDTISQALGSLGGSVAEIFGGNSNSDLFSHFGEAVSAAASGNKLIWPQIWKNSTFSRQYNLSFEFVSPYGSPEAIFRYVYLPFITLLTLAMPKQISTNGYSNPFLVRIDMPGSFTSDLAVIQNMSWRKGGNDNLFTNDGLPLAITVDISVQDLYPSMMMSEYWAQLRHNTGMHSFLDNMAGLSVERFTPWQNIKNSLAIKSVNVLGNIERATVSKLKTKIYNVTKDALGPLFGSAVNQ